MKCLILCMCCNEPEYLKQWEDIKETWGKDILDGKYQDIDIYMYTASKTSDYKIDKTNHIIYVPVIDSLDGTFEKTVKTIQVLNTFGIYYNCLLRTNCSTVINIKLLDKFIHSDLYDLNKIYSGEIFTCSYKAAPTSKSIFARGNFILMSYFYANLLNQTNLNVLKQINDYNRVISRDMFYYDDITIYAIFNTYLILNNIDPLTIYQRLPVQYLYNVYNNKEELYANNIAFFIKKFGDGAGISETYNYNKALLNDFYSKYYNILSSDLDNLRSDLDILKYIEQHVIIDESNAYIKRIPYNEYKF